MLFELNSNKLKLGVLELLKSPSTDFVDHMESFLSIRFKRFIGEVSGSIWFSRNLRKRIL